MARRPASSVRFEKRTDGLNGFNRFAQIEIYNYLVVKNPFPLKFQ